MGIEQLEPFIGKWRMEADLPGSDGVEATAVFEWILGGQFVLERSEVSVPEAPDGHCVIAANADADGFTQHYFDSRGVVRVYGMTFDGRKWQLLRVTPDFSPLDFSQRYQGELSEDGARIEGRWESSNDRGANWDLDFHLTYQRVD